MSEKFWTLSKRDERNAERVRPELAQKCFAEEFRNPAYELAIGTKVHLIKYFFNFRTFSFSSGFIAVKYTIIQ